jgi:hypothetical protein
LFDGFKGDGEIKKSEGKLISKILEGLFVPNEIKEAIV